MWRWSGLARVRLVLIIAVVGLITWLGVDWWVRRSPLFAIEDIIVSGCHVLDPQTVILMSGVRQGANIFSVEGEEVKRRVEASPRIKSISLRRRLPRTLLLRVIERQAIYPVAHHPDRALSSDGLLLPIHEMDPVRKLPAVAGIATDRAEIDQGQVACYLQLAHSEQHWMFDRVDVSHPNDIVGTLVQGSQCVHLGSGNFRAKLMLLEAVVSDLVAERIPFNSIDLRYHNQAIVR